VARIPRILVFAAAFFAAPPAMAGPTVLRDDVLRDLAITPVIGRGYSLATNTYQSICFGTVVKTKPSYDFQFVFRELDAEQAASLKSTGTVELDVALGGAGVSAGVDAKVEQEVTQRLTRTRTYLQVSIDMTSYYSSIDESSAALSTPAATLLRAGDITGFFDACGMYYVRSINRRSRYVSLFEYDAVSREDGARFAADLEAEIKGWGQQAGGGGGLSRETTQAASRRKLSITASGWGLGKAQTDGLVSYDLESFRKSVKAAFAATQEDDIGKVVSIEVVPWTEYAEFQALLLGQGTRGANKRYLLVNAEFLAEIDRSARARLNAFYSSKQCRAQIDATYRRTIGGTAAWRTSADTPGVSYGDYYARNHRIPGDRSLTMRQLYEAVRPAVQQFLYDEYDAFMYGGKDDLPRIVQNGVETVNGRVPDVAPPPSSAQRRAWLDQATTTLRGLLEAQPADPGRTALELRLVATYYAKVQGTGVPALADLAALTTWYEDATAAARRIPGIATANELVVAALEDALNVTTFAADSEIGWWQAAAAGLLDALPYRVRATDRLPEEEAVAALLDAPMRAYIERVLSISLSAPPRADDLVDGKQPPPSPPGAGYDALLAYINSEGFANLVRARPAREIAVNALMALLRTGTIEGVGAPLDSALDTYAVTRLLGQMREHGRDALAEEVERLLDARLAPRVGAPAPTTGAAARWAAIRTDAALAKSTPSARIAALLSSTPPTADDIPGLDPTAPLDSLERMVAQELFADYRRHGARPGRRPLSTFGFFASGELVGAARCIDALLTDNRLLTDSYRNIETCQRVERQLATASSRIVDDYCPARALRPPPPKKPAPPASAPAPAR
jgi:hypothetical protein